MSLWLEYNGSELHPASFSSSNTEHCAMTHEDLVPQVITVPWLVVPGFSATTHFYASILKYSLTEA